MPMRAPDNSCMGCLECRKMLPVLLTAAMQKPAKYRNCPSKRKQSTNGTGPASISPFSAAGARALGTMSYNSMPRRSMSK